MPAPVRIRRKNNLNVLREAKKLESFDEFPLLRPEVDPQLHASNNRVDQPFWLTCEKDSVLTQATGSARVEFRSGSVRYFDMAPGEFVYVPGGATHRVLVKEAGIQLRYKARDAGEEAVSWFCPECDEELFRFAWKGDEMPAQAGYLEGVKRFNASDRTCAASGVEHPPVDLSPFRWGEVVAALERDEDDDD